MKQSLKHSDAELVGKAREGDQAAFRELVLRYQDRVAAIAIGMLGRTAEAEEVGQDTFIRFFRALDQFRGEASLGTYLSRIAINLSLNAAKARQNRQARQVAEEAADMPALGSREHEQRADAREVVRLALAKLEPEFRSVIVLHMLEGYPTVEVAELLEIPKGTVLSRLKRGRDKLKVILEGWMT